MAQKLLNSLSNKNKRILCLVAIYMVVLEILLLSWSFTDPATRKENVMDKHFINLTQCLDSLAFNVSIGSSKDINCVLFTRARNEYKHIEMVIEYVYPFYAKYFINGPPNFKHDIENGNKVFAPHGFQFLEPIFFGLDKGCTKGQILDEINLLKETLNRTWKKFKSVVPSNEQYFDMMQLEILRIITLNINGYDASITQSNIRETHNALQGIKELIIWLAKNSEVNSNLKPLIQKLQMTQTYLSLNPDYISFNRLIFITDYIKPLYKELCLLRLRMKVAQTPVKYAVNLNEPILFSKMFFNRDYFSVNLNDSSKSKEQAELGRLLFFDPILSANNKRACASCHKPQFGFADSVKANLEISGLKRLKRNTPSLINVMYQRSFFYDGRSLQMEDQVSDVLHALNEMNNKPEVIVKRLKDSPGYLQKFRNAYKGTEDTLVTFYAVLKAISEFEKTIVSNNSRFDQYLQGNKKALSINEINGYNLFSGKALCGTCHFLPLFNGTTPPVYAENEFEVIGTTLGPGSKTLDSDSGRYNITQKEIHIRAFKTPGLKNIALTAPYMHNGAFNTLEEVIEFYNKGGGFVAVPAIQNQTLPFDSLQLTAKEKADIKSFLIALTDKIKKEIKPAQLPVFKTKEWNNRKVGGEY